MSWVPMKNAVSIPISARLPAVAFGQQSGPPASANQVQELLALLKDAGHSDFRDTRGPMGFIQRRAAGKFTRDEARAFIDRYRTKSWGAPRSRDPGVATVLSTADHPPRAGRTAHD
jgi:hypothetical protein